MSDTANLTIKLPVELKEKIKAIAEEKSVSMSAEIGERLVLSINQDSESGAYGQHAGIDSQYTQEITEQPLTEAEIKKLRQLLNMNLRKKLKKK